MWSISVNGRLCWMLVPVYELTIIAKDRRLTAIAWYFDAMDL